MIRSVVIRNFQKHKLLKLKLDPRITTIVGRSDIGKSAVLRALRWVLLNEAPRNFQRKGSAETSVSLRADGKLIKRTKGQSNTFHLDDKKFTAFGKEVPKEVADLLNVSDLNFQNQHDSPFWFAKSAGEVSRQLNSIVDLGEIDTTLSNLASMQRKTRAEQAVAKDRLRAAVQEARELRWVAEANKQLKRIEGTECRIAQLEDDRAWIAKLLDQAEEHRTAARNRRVARDASRQLRRVSRLCERVERLREQHRGLRDLIEEAQRCAEGGKEMNEQLKKLHGELDKLMGDACPLCRQPINVQF